MNLEGLKTAEELHQQSMDDPEYRAEWERTLLAHEIALRVLQYRVEHKLTQTQLAELLGMRQPHIARLEAGDHEPSLATLSRLARVLGMEFHIDITPETLALSA
jgi:DNA-binding XRE family transcriptional regulator